MDSVPNINKTIEKRAYRRAALASMTAAIENVLQVKNSDDEYGKRYTTEGRLLGIVAILDVMLPLLSEEFPEYK